MSNFGGIPGTEIGEASVYPVPSHKDTRVAIATGSGSAGHVGVRVPQAAAADVQTVGDYRRALVRSCSSRCLTPGSAKSPGAGRAIPRRIRGRRHAGPHGRSVRRLGARHRRRDPERARRARAGARARAPVRLRRGGARSGQGQRCLHATSARYNERDKSESPGFASELVSAISSTGEPAPGIETEYDLATTFIPTITPTEAPRSRASS